MTSSNDGQNVYTSDMYANYSKSRIGPIISDQAYDYFEVVMCTLFAIISALGIVTNTLCVVVYYKLGICDSVTVTFVALSLWDMGSCLMVFITDIFSIIEAYFPVPTINFLHIQYVYIGYTRGLMYILSTIVTVYLSTERCLCMMSPFKVKTLFTKFRSTLINFGILIFGLTTYIPAWATQSLHWMNVQDANYTRLVLKLSGHRRSIDMFIDTFNGVFIPTVSQCVISVCTMLMILKLKESAQFRKTSTAKNSLGRSPVLSPCYIGSTRFDLDSVLENKESETSMLSDIQKYEPSVLNSSQIVFQSQCKKNKMPIPNGHYDGLTTFHLTDNQANKSEEMNFAPENHQILSGGRQSKPKAAIIPDDKIDDKNRVSGKDKLMSNKEAKLTVVVISMAILFFICNLPVLIVACVRAMLPELDINKREYNLYNVLYSLVYLFGLVNAIVNLLVYYSASTKFRDKFHVLFDCRASTRCL